MDVIVCDGFIGNVALKISEGVAQHIAAVLKKSLKSTIASQVGYVLSRSAYQEFRRKIDYSEYGGAPLLGVRGIAIIGHGRSNANAIKNAVRVAAELANARVNERRSSRSFPLCPIAVGSLIRQSEGASEIQMGGVAFCFPVRDRNMPAWAGSWRIHFRRPERSFDEADRALGFSISELCFTGPEEALKLTENTQPAILTVSVAAYRVLEEKGIRPDYVAGHSLGEYSALVAAGALKFADALRLVRRRGQYMQEAVPPGEGAMAAILGMRPGQVAEICRKATDGKVAPANLNSPDQTVISGDAAAVKSAVEQASAAGAKRAVVLPVSAPFHSELMRPAQERLAERFARDEFSALRIPLVTNVDAGVITSGAEAREALIRQVTLPVRWEESIRELIEQGATTFVEVGPGRVLSGLLRQIDRSVHSLNVEDVKSLQTALERLAQMRGEGADAEAS